MRRLSLQLVALALSLGAVRLVTGADLFAPYLVRDGLIVAALGAVIFALHAGGWRAAPAYHQVAAIPHWGQILLATGLACMLAGGVLAGMGLPSLLGLAAWLVWSLGIVLVIAGVWWPGAEVAYDLPRFRWEKDASGAFVRVAAGRDEEESSPAMVTPGRRRWLWWLLVVVLLATLLRLWNLTGMPPGCVGVECINGLRLVDGQPLTFSVPGTFNLYEQATRFLFVLTSASVFTLRLVSAVTGIVGVVVFAALTRRLTQPAFVPLALLLIALNPWHLWASRSAEPWIATALFVSLALWLALRALARGDLRGWVPAGLALGLLFVEAPALRLALLGWTAVIAAVGIGAAVHSPRRRATNRSVFAGLAAAIGIALPSIVAGLRSGTLILLPGSAGAMLDNAATLAGALLRPDASFNNPFTAAGLLSSVAMVLVITGCGVLLRHLRQGAAVLVAAGLSLVAIAAAGMDQSTTPPASVLLALLPFLLAIAAISLDRLLNTLVATWGRTVAPRRLVMGAGFLLAAILGAGVLRFYADLDSLQAAGERPVETELARYVGQELATAPETLTTFIVPPAALQHPSMRLLAGQALAAGRVQPLDVARTMPFAALPPGDLLYLIPATDGQIIELLRQIYPAGSLHTEVGSSGERALFHVLRVPERAVVEGQGMQLLVYAGGEVRSADEADASLTVKTTDLPWATSPPVPLPFAAEGYATLLVPEAGDYIFAIDAAPGAAYVLKLDELLVLDSGLGLREQVVPLAQGVYRLELVYRSGPTPGDLRLRWQRPNQPFTILSPEVLHLPVLANVGLLGTYTGNAGVNDVTLTRRKDLVVGMDPDLSEPYRVHWQGKLAAPRSGEYLISSLADGINTIAVDGQVVVDSRGDTGTAYSEGLIYLAQGWHLFDVRYVPAHERSDFRMLWQPAGGQAGELSSFYLRPTTGELGVVDQPLPPAPALIDAGLGNDQFALSRASGVWQPAIRLPPVGLEPLLLETLWSVGEGCGAAPRQFNSPHGIAFDPRTSRLLVADTANRRVQVLELDGAQVGSINSELFQEPVDVAIAADGAPLVLDALAGAIFRVEADNTVTPLALQTSFYRPRGLAVGRFGSLYVADTGGGRIAILGPNGTLEGELGGLESLLSRGQPVDALEINNAIWAVSAEDGRLWNLPVDGSLTAIQPTNTLDGPHLAALPNGSFLVSDPGRRTFTVVQPTGQPVQQFAYVDQLVVPTGVAAMGAGDFVFIAATDTRSCSVSLWRIAANQLK